MANPTNPWFGISMALIGVIAGYGVALGTNALPASDGAAAPQAAVVNAPTPTPEPEVAGDMKPVDKDRDHIRGNVDGPIYVVEYSDYECPFCARHPPTMQSVIDNNDNVGWVYRHFPLGFHASAQPTAEASECVYELGGDDAFWKFTDIVFERGADAAKIQEYADAAGVDGAKVKSCLDAGKYTDYVTAQMAEGSTAVVNGTPGNIVVNSKTNETRLVSGAQPLASFQSAIDALE